MKFFKVGICFFLIKLFGFCNVIIANPINLDSLELELAKISKEKHKLEILATLAKEYAPISFDKSIKYGREGLLLSRSYKSLPNEAHFMLLLGDAYSYGEVFDEAERMYNDAIQLYTKANNNEGIASALIGVGFIKYLNNDFKKAIHFYSIALTNAKLSKSGNETGNACFNLGQVYRKINLPDSAMYFYKKALSHFEPVANVNGLAKTFNSMGLVQAETGNYNDAILYYSNALEYREKAGELNSCAILYNNMGNVLFKWGRYESAIIEYQKAMKIFESLENLQGIARCSNNIGLVYENLTRGERYNHNIGLYEKALAFHKKAFEVWERAENKFEIANSLNNIANVQARIAFSKITDKYGNNWESKEVKKDQRFISDNYAPVIENYQKSLVLREEIGDENGVAGSLVNLGKVYIYTNNHDIALTFLTRAVQINKKLGRQYEAACSFYELSHLYYSTGKNDLALQYANFSYQIAQKIGMASIVKDVNLLKSRIYQAMGDYKKSLAAYMVFVEMQDSILSENNLKQIAELQTLYETEKKEKHIELLNKDAKLKDIQIKQKNATIYFFIAGMVMVLCIALLLLRQNKERKKANKELEYKNQLITQQKQEITDSIYYARRIQQAVLPFENQIKHLLPHSFIYFRPRDIVSGDFYWITEKNEKVIVVTADCTGHGVPGAFMSMLGVAMLNNIIAKKDSIEACEILNELRANIIHSLHQSGREGENKDGMDLSLYILDNNALTVDYAGANNPLYLVRNGELTEIKADRMPIGIHEKAAVPFKSVKVPLLHGDMLYTFSDGYSDQFGGPMGKKYMSANLKKLLCSIFNKPVESQHKIVHTTISEWMKEYSQIDDILLIGVRV